MATAEIPDTAAAERASGSSFYTAMRILPRAQREAMFEIYSFCRQVDDIADSRGPREERRRELDRWRADIDALYAGRAALRAAGPGAGDARIRVEREDFLAVIDGMEMDVIADIRAPDNAMLDLYCDRVASAVGRLSVRVFGMAEAPGIALAHHLGRALQLTNILRDLDEDAAIGRLYLPAEALRAAGIAATEPTAVLANPALGKVCAHLAERARAHFAEADDDHGAQRRAARCARRASWREAYRLILDRLVARGWAPPRHRSASRKRVWRGSSCATPSSDAGHRPRHRRRPRRARRRGAPRRARRARHRARGGRPGRRALPLLSRSRARHGDRQRQPSAAVGQSCGAGLSSRRSAPRTRSPVPPAPTSRSSISPAASAGPCASMRAGCRGGSSIRSRRVPGTTRARLSAAGAAAVGVRRQDRSARSSTARARSTTGWRGRCFSPRSTPSRRKAAPRSPARSCARRWRPAARPAGR